VVLIVNHLQTGAEKAGGEAEATTQKEASSPAAPCRVAARPFTPRHTVRTSTKPPVDMAGGAIRDEDGCAVRDATRRYGSATLPRAGRRCCQKAERENEEYGRRGRTENLLRHGAEALKCPPQLPFRFFAARLSAHRQIPSTENTPILPPGPEPRR